METNKELRLIDLAENWKAKQKELSVEIRDIKARKAQFEETYHTNVRTYLQAMEQAKQSYMEGVKKVYDDTMDCYNTLLEHRKELMEKAETEYLNNKKEILKS